MNKLMKASKKIAFSSILAAISVIMMLIGSFFGSLDLTAAAIASFCVIIAVIEMGCKSAVIIYAVSSALALIVLPSKMPAVYFAVFLGYFPIIKSISERFSSAVSYAIKFATYFVAYAALSVIVITFFPEAELRKYLMVVCFLGAIVLFVYDIALTRIIASYCKTLRQRLGVNKFFGNNGR